MYFITNISDHWEVGELESSTEVKGIVLARNIKEGFIEEGRLTLGFNKLIGFR